MAEAQSRCSYREFCEWIAFDKIEPFGAVRDDLRIAQLCALTANINRGKGTRPFRVNDFMFDFTRDKKQKSQTAKQMQMTLGSLARATNEAYKYRVEVVH